jgi:predicted nucleotidyltransferase
MVQRKNKNIDIIKKAKKEFQKKVNIDKLIFFGSRAKGNTPKDSDFDLIVVSDDFKKVPRHKRAVKLYLAWNKKYPADILCYTKKEIEEKRKQKWGIVREAINTGIEI